MSKIHLYESKISWTGNLGSGTSGYKNYSRSYDISVAQKPVIRGSSDPMFSGDISKHNPEDLFLSSISSCHMLWYLHLCSDNNIIVEEYNDIATAKMQIDSSGSGKFIEATLNPTIRIKNMEHMKLANELHELAHKYCFIANSLNFEILINSNITCS